MARVEGLTTEGITALVTQQVAAATDAITLSFSNLVAEQLAAYSATIDAKAPISSTFQSNTAYKAGQLIFNGSRLYSAKVDFTSSSSFNIANWNYVDCPVLCTSTTRPSGVQGLMIYETDTKLIYVYDTTWMMIKPDGPRGRVASIVGGSGDMPGGTTVFLNLTFAAVAGRRYRITGYAVGSQITNVTGACRVHLYTNANGDTTNVFYYNDVQVGDYCVGTGVLYLTAASTGNVIASMSMLTTASALRLTSNESYIYVEDIGI